MVLKDRPATKCEKNLKHTDLFCKDISRINLGYRKYKRVSKLPSSNCRQSGRDGVKYSYICLKWFLTFNVPQALLEQKYKREVDGWDVNVNSMLQSDQRVATQSVNVLANCLHTQIQTKHHLSFICYCLGAASLPFILELRISFVLCFVIKNFVEL